jgi:hypothetical protein
MQGTTAKWKIYRTPTIERKRNSNQSNQSRYYSYFYLKTNQKHTNYAIRTAKRTEDALKATL